MKRRGRRAPISTRRLRRRHCRRQCADVLCPAVRARTSGKGGRAERASITRPSGAPAVIRHARLASPAESMQAGPQQRSPPGGFDEGGTPQGATKWSMIDFAPRPDSRQARVVWKHPAMQIVRRAWQGNNDTCRESAHTEPLPASCGQVSCFGDAIGALSATVGPKL